MSGSTESYYVSFETAKILKKRGYVPDYAGRDNAYDREGQDPSFYKYVPFSKEEEEEIEKIKEKMRRSRILKNLKKQSLQNFKDYISEHPEDEEWIREGLRENEDKD